VPQEQAALREFRLAHPVRQEAEVPQPMETARGHMPHQPSQKLHGIEREGA